MRPAGGKIKLVRLRDFKLYPFRIAPKNQRSVAGKYVYLPQL